MIGTALALGMLAAGAGSKIASSVIASNASKSAAATQTAGAERAANLATAAGTASMAREAPFISAGAGATQNLAHFLGTGRPAAPVTMPVTGPVSGGMSPALSAPSGGVGGATNLMTLGLRGGDTLPSGDPSLNPNAAWMTSPDGSQSIQVPWEKVPHYLAKGARMGQGASQ